MVSLRSKFRSAFGAGHLSEEEKLPFTFCVRVRERLVVEVAVASGRDVEILGEFTIP